MRSRPSGKPRRCAVTPNSAAVRIRRAVSPLPAQSPVPRGRRPVAQLPELGFIAYKVRLKLVKLSWRTRRPPSQWRGRRPVLCWPLSPGQQGTGKPASRQSRTVSGPSSHLFYRDHVKFHLAIAPLTSPFTARRTALTRPLWPPDLDGSGRSIPWRLGGVGRQAVRGPAVPEVQVATWPLSSLATCSARW